ncbi:tetratricopeptide repeat protein 27 [Halyomorpha halys]|uniref:tetratricopeptide repeat protein 27 n=1 Tax=Halyomorpha halys TaxID=286706 RepID=UPI0006D4FA12
MNAFIQSNWIGPEFKAPESLTVLLTPMVRKCFPDDKPRHKNVADCIELMLSEDGEEICSSILNPELLVMAQAIFGSNLSELRTPDWWLLRSTYIQQQILDEQSPTLQEQLNRLSNRVQNFTWISNYKYLQVLSELEIARIHLHYGKISASDKEIKKALSMLRMDINLTGALGKRTYYQNRDIAQLMISVNVDRNNGIENDCDLRKQGSIDFPKDVLLNDDVRMPQVAFTNPQDGDFPALYPLEQATLLAVYVFKKKSQAKDHLQNEELMPFLNCLLSHPKVWAFQFSALHLRSRLECEHKRTIERALVQTQNLMEVDSNKTPITERLFLFYCSYAPPSFIVASECASMLVSTGSFQSALDLFLKLQLWDEVIACYNYLKLRHKAAEVIREQLKKGETVKLLCSLGDATDDVQCYERAWELSNHKSAQAKRHWGMFYFNKKMYNECIEHFKQSLAINSLQIAIWFRLGYATLMERRWEESATAYRRYCALEPDSFEAWNNLAKAYILLGQKHRAYNALQEAIKCNFETWQVWDNLMAVSNDCGDFEEVIHCYHRILDLKEKHIDEQILTVLTSVIVNNVKDCKGQPASIHRKKALELFGRITSKVMGNPIIWQLYAQLTSSIEDQTSITRSKAIQYYQRAYTAATQDNSWFRDYESMQNVFKLCEKLADAHLTFVKECASTNEAASSLSSAKFAIANVIAKINQQMENVEKSEINGTINNDLMSLQKTLETVQDELAKIKSC